MTSTTTLAPDRGRLRGLRAGLRANPALVPAVLAVAVFLVLSASDGGFYPIGTGPQLSLGWYPAGLLLLALLVASITAIPPPRPLPRPVLAALVLLGGFTLWSFLSITWAEQQGVAWDGANRSAVYLVVFSLFALWPFTRRGGMLVVGLLGVGIAGLGLVELLRANAAVDPSQFFVSARLAEPAGYINANVALWMLGLWPCLLLASSREVNPLLRGLCLGGAGLLVCLAMMSQSRGWLFALPLAILVFIVLMPGRTRTLLTLGAVAAAAVAASAAVLAVHDEYSSARLDGLLADATSRILVTCAVLAVVGIVAALIDRRVHLTAGRARTVDRVALVALGLVLVLGVAVFAAREGSPITSLSDSWEEFKSDQGSPDVGGSRFASAGTNRYDFWTVAWDRFTDRPVVGIGSANFQLDYLEQGTSTEQPRYPHSLELGVLSQTGIVGAVLLLAALIAAALAVLRIRRRGTPGEAAVAVAATATCAYWLLHGSVDWFWEFPALTAVAFAMLGLAGAIGRGSPTPSDEPAPQRRVARVVAAGAGAAVAAVLALSLTAPWLAERQMDRAIDEWPSSPARAFDRLGQAESLNPLTPKPHVIAAAIAIQVEDATRASGELEEVLEQEPRTALALAQLGALASERGDRRGAEALLRRASGHAPNDEVVSEALEQLRSGEQLEVSQLNARYAGVARDRLGRN